MTNPNDPAFEQPILGERENGSTFAYAYGGLTKREYFSAMAMQSLIAIRLHVDKPHAEIAISEAACTMADALIAELSKTEDAGK